MPLLSPVAEPNQTEAAKTAAATVEISVRGKWFNVPALGVGTKAIVVNGKRIKTAIIHDEEWLDSEVEDPELCIKKLKAQPRNGLRADLFTFAQKLPATVPKYKYPMEWDSIAAAPTSNFKAWWESLPQETRKNVRRAQKRGVVVKVQQGLDDNLIRGIAEVNNESPVRQRIPNVHYGKSLEQVRKDQTPFVDRTDFICAYIGDELIGFLRLVYRGKIASILQLLPKSAHFDKRPTNALIAKAVELCEAKGVSHLTYGMFNYGNKKDSPLREFKIRNGFEEILVPRYFVPLTPWGALCVKLKLHRGHLGLLPHSVIVLGGNVRARWYNLKHSISRCSLTSERPNSDRQMGRSIPPAGSNV